MGTLASTEECWKLFVEDAREVEVVDNEVDICDSSEVGSMDRGLALSKDTVAGGCRHEGEEEIRGNDGAIMEHVVEDSNDQSRGQ